MRPLPWVAAIAATLFFSAPASGQSGGGFDITWSSIDGGGQQTVGAGIFDMSGTLGQPDAYFANAGGFEARGGFRRANCSGTFENYGVGCPGTGGFIPQMDITGCMEQGLLIDFTFSSAVPGTPGFLFMGTGQGTAPMGGGCLLHINNLLPIILGPLPIFGPSPGNGSLAFDVTVGTVPPGLSLYLQAFFTDPGGGIGFSGTNAVKLTFG